MFVFHAASNAATILWNTTVNHVVLMGAAAAVGLAGAYIASRLTKH